MLQADFRREGERVSRRLQRVRFQDGDRGAPTKSSPTIPFTLQREACRRKTDSALGAAFVADKNTKNWRMTWDVDAVASTNASWRAGGYMKLIHTPPEQITSLHQLPQSGETAETKPAKKTRINLVHPYTVFHLYAQSISLNKINFYGLGNDSTQAGAVGLWHDSNNRWRQRHQAGL
jgi:hypothetical protein